MIEYVFIGLGIFTLIVFATGIRIVRPTERAVIETLGNIINLLIRDLIG